MTRAVNMCQYIRLGLSRLLFFTIAWLGLGFAPALSQDLTGDADLGRKVYFSRCIACHEPPTFEGLTEEELARNEAALPADEQEATPGRGPSLAGLIGRKAGSLPGYDYSDAMKAADLTWTSDTLQQFLMKPSAFIPRNKMAFNGIKRDGEIEDIIAYFLIAAQ